jgi:hypothetical protein
LELFWVAAEGAAAGAAVTSVLIEFGSRLLDHREMVRVGAAAIYARRACQDRIAESHALRDDGWFDNRPGGRSIAAEICEGTLLIAQREHQERKSSSTVICFANLGFAAEVDEYLANWLLKGADELTWMQLVLLAMIGRKQQFDLPDILIGDRQEGDWTLWGLHEQLADLGWGRRELILLLKPSTARRGSAFPESIST